MFVKGNSIELLKNGDEIFRAMLAAVRSAEGSVCFETYIYWSGEIADEFAEALSERARVGVRVHALIDWYGSIRMDEGLIEMMEAAGVQVIRFRPPKWYSLRRANHRTHRKLLIVDGHTAFTGGVGIADEWTGDAEDPDHWRDNHYRVSGPVVPLILQRFFDNWRNAGKELPPLGDRAYYPDAPECGATDIKVVAASPLAGADNINHLFFSAVEGAQKSIDLATAYFVPGDELEESLVRAARRGVRVRILLCGEHIDETIVRFASRACWGMLLRAGIEIIEYQPTLFHTKAIAIDGAITIVGSANFDARSCRINDELSLLVRDSEFAERHTREFQDDCALGSLVALADWEQRPLKQKILDGVASWFRPQL